VFPRPNADGLKLWMVGQMDLDAFSSNTDRTTIDSHLVYLWALAAGKAHYGKKDAQNAQNRAGSYLLDVIAGKHATARYVPRYAVPPPEVQPVMTVYNTGRDVGTPYQLTAVRGGIDRLRVKGAAMQDVLFDG
jgi:hypothetical protein